MFSPKNLLDVAKELCAENVTTACESQALYRTSINRAYYAAFLTARAKYFVDDESKGVHELVIRAAKADEFNLGTKLEIIRNKRNKADYHLDKEVTEDMAKNALRIAAEVIDGCDV